MTEPSQPERHIVVEEKSGKAAAVLREILANCGCRGWRVVSAEETDGKEFHPALLLSCDGRKISDPRRFSACVCRYELAGRSCFSGLCPVTYSAQDERADFTARNIRTAEDGTTAFDLVGMGVIGRVRLAARSARMAEPVLAAASAAASCGIPLASVLDALNRVKIKDGTVFP